MEGANGAARLEALLVHRAWVRRVARALVRDESRADDLEQEVWLRSLDGPAPDHPRAWLGTVLRHAAFNLRRGERRRELHEAERPPPPPVPSPEVLLGRAEAVERVARAVRELEEPCRSAILLRYFEDIPPPAIARRLGVPLETVRARLRRGLARLRERLDREDRGGRRRWALLLLPPERCAGPAGRGAGGAALLLGGVAVTAKAKAGWIAAAALLLLLAGAVPWLHPGGEGAPPAPRPVPPPPEIAAAPAPVPPPLSPVAPEPAVPRPILVLDSSGRPAAGARVDALRVQPSGMDGTRPVARDLGSTDGEGRIPWPDDAIVFPCVVRATHGESSPGEAIALSRESEVVLHLGRGEFLEGAVLAADGAPVAGAVVTAEVLPLGNILGPHLGLTGTWTGSTRTGADGGFRLGGLPPPASGLVTVTAAGFMETRVPWRPAEREPMRIVLERPFASRVRVRDRAGQAVDGASVWVFQGPRQRMGRWLAAEPEVLPLPSVGRGEYGRDDLPAGWCWLLVAAKGYRLTVREDVGFGRTLAAVEVVLEEAPGLRGRVVRADTTEPVAGVRVRAIPLREIAPGTRVAGGRDEALAYWTPVSEMEGPFVAVTGADGAYELPVFAPSDRLRLEALADDGSRGWAEHPLSPGTENAEIADIRLHRLLRDVDYSGRVVTEAGEPIAGAIVEGNAAVAVAGRDGRFRLVDRQAGTGIQFLAPGFLLRSRSAPGSTPQGGGFGAQDFGDVVLAPLAEIRGTVVDGEGRPLPGETLWAEPVGRDAARALFREFGFSGAAGRSDPAGEAMLRVPAGQRYSVHPFDGTSRGSVEVAGADGETFRLVLAPPPGTATGTLRGRLRLEDGSWRPCRATVGVRSAMGSSPAPAPGRVDPEGGFEIRGVPDGIWDLRVVGSGDLEGGLAGVAVTGGGTVEVDLPCRRLAGEGDGPVVLRVRAVPVPADPSSLRGWATRRSAARSVPLAAAGEGVWECTVVSGAPCVLHVFDVKEMTAGVATASPRNAGNPIPVALAPAGLLLPPGWEYGTPDPWIEVRDGDGAVLYSGGQSALPVVPDAGYALVLPPGTYRVEIATGAERSHPRTVGATVVAGRATRIE